MCIYQLYTSTSIAVFNIVHVNDYGIAIGLAQRQTMIRACTQYSNIATPHNTNSHPK